jgi:ferric-dicitrate binding protein FerR (iron transport regulator)
MTCKRRLARVFCRTVAKFTTAGHVEQTAAEWIVRIERDGSPENCRALDVWLAERPRHRAAFLRLSAAWRRADCLRKLAPPGKPPDPDLLAG